MMKHNFPATIFASLNTPGEQLDHIMSEFDEVSELGQWLDRVLDREATADKVRRNIELEVLDVYHSIETFLRILERDHGRDYVLGLWQEIEAKNRQRGYYGVDRG